MLPEHLTAALRAATGDISVASTLPPVCYTDAQVLAAEDVRAPAKELARCRALRRVAGAGRLLGARSRGHAGDRAPRRGAAPARLREHLPSPAAPGSWRAAATRRAFAAPSTAGPTASTEACAAPPAWGRHGAFRRADMGLVELRAAERGGFAFVALSGETPGIDEWLGAFDALLAPWRLDELGDHPAPRARGRLQLEALPRSLQRVLPLGRRARGDLRRDLPGAGAAGRGRRLRPPPPSVPPPAPAGSRRTTRRTCCPPCRVSAPASGRAPAIRGCFRRSPSPRERGALGLRRAAPWSATLPGHPVGVLPARDPSPARASKRRRNATTHAWTRRSRRTSRCSSASSSGWSRPFARAGRWSDLERGAAAFGAWYARRLVQA